MITPKLLLNPKTSLCVILLVAPLLVAGEVLFSESFDYPAGNLSGQGDHRGNSWYLGMGLNQNGQVEVGSLTYPHQPSFGNRLRLTHEDVILRVLLYHGDSTPFFTHESAATIFISLFANVPDVANVQSWTGFNLNLNFGTSMDPNYDSVYLSFSPNLRGSGNWNAHVADKIGDPIGVVDLKEIVSTETVHLVMKFTYNPDGNEVVEAAINPAFGIEPSWITVLDHNLGDSGFSSRFLGFRNDAGDGVYNETIFDELRIGTSLADVVAVPEHATSALLLGMIGLGIAGTRLCRKNRAGAGR